MLNSFYTGYGIGNTDASIASLDATCNWWGSASGPGPVGPGTGSPVTPNVDFSTWLTTSNLAGPCNGPLPPPPPPLTEKDQCKNDGWMNYGFKNQGQCVKFMETGKDSR